MGIILVNTAEDYPEDLEAKINTSIVAVGLHRGIGLAFWLAGAGAALAIAALLMIFRKRGLGEAWLLAVAPAAAACLYVLRDIWKLKSLMAGQGLERAIQTVKASAKKVPIWLTVVAWSMLAATFAIFLGTHN
jgi:4-hydroxybenzoate polyprenyltransferase